jgi:hypothetical protein
MSLKDFKTIEIEDRVTSKLQDNVKLFVNQINKVITDGVFVEVTVGTVETLVEHKLGRQFLGWHLVDLQGDARVWRVATSTADQTKFLPLRSSIAVRVKLWVF